MRIAKRPRIALVNVYFPPQAIGGATRVLADNLDVFLAEYADAFEFVGFTTEAEHLAKFDAVHDTGQAAGRGSDFGADDSAGKMLRRVEVYPWRGMRVYKANAYWRPDMDWHPEDAAMGAVFAKFLDFEKPDLVHFHCIQRITASAIEQVRRRKIPYVVTVHDAWWISDFQFLVDPQGNVYADGHPDYVAPPVLPPGITAEQSLERRGYLKSLLRAADFSFTVSAHFRELYLRNGVTDIKVIRNGIVTSGWRPKNTGYTSRVVCAHIGGLAEHKGFPVFRAAMERRQPENVEILLVDHAQGESYERRTHWGRVPVRTIGRVAQERMVDLYGAIDVLFAPSIWPESFGLVTREAAACACWVVASDRGGIGEDVNAANGFVVEPCVRDLARTIDIIARDPARYKGPAAVSPLRSVADQVGELADWYRKLTTLRHARGEPA